MLVDLDKLLKSKKGKILKVGTVDDGTPNNWGFDSDGVPALQINTDTGDILYSGYSVEELQFIARHPESVMNH